MIWSVSHVSGMSGSRNIGSVSGSSPISPTVRTSQPNATVKAVRTMIVTNGEGIALVMSGKR
jgi:hypothetical protein